MGFLLILWAFRHHQGLVVVPTPKVDKVDKNIHFFH